MRRAPPVKSPSKDRTELLRDITSFIQRQGTFLSQQARRLSDLFEMTVYNDAVRYYIRKKCKVAVCNLASDGSFLYKLTPSGLTRNFSYFVVTLPSQNPTEQSAAQVEIHHNVKVQSAHDAHLYDTPDVAICKKSGVSTVTQKNGRKHSYIRNDTLVTFLEAKNMIPFPSIIYGFSGHVLELIPDLITNKVKWGFKKAHLTPSICFSGMGNEHTERIAVSLGTRYGFNVISGLYASKGQIYSFKNLNEFDS